MKVEWICAPDSGNLNRGKSNLASPICWPGAGPTQRHRAVPGRQLPISERHSRPKTENGALVEPRRNYWLRRDTPSGPLGINPHTHRSRNHLGPQDSEAPYRRPTDLTWFRPSGFSPGYRLSARETSDAPHGAASPLVRFSHDESTTVVAGHKSDSEQTRSRCRVHSHWAASIPVGKLRPEWRPCPGYCLLC